MRNHLIELCVGEALQVGQYLVRLVELDGDQLCLEVESDDGEVYAEVVDRDAVCVG